MAMAETISILRPTGICLSWATGGKVTKKPVVVDNGL